MAYQVRGTYGTGVGPVYYHVRKKFLEDVYTRSSLAKLCQTKTIPLNSGEYLKLTRRMQLPLITSALTEGTKGTPQKVYAQDINVRPDTWGGSIQVSRMLQDTFISPALEAYTGQLSEQAFRSMNLELQKTILGEDADEATTLKEAEAGCILMSADADAYGTYNLTFTATTTGTTTSFISSAVSATNDEYNGGVITFTHPASQNYGLARRIENFTSGDDAIHWTSPVKVAPSETSASGEAETVAVGYNAQSLNLTAGTDVMTSSLCRRAKAMLDKHMARTFKNGFYRGSLDPENFFHLSADSGVGAWGDTKYTTVEYIQGFPTTIMRIGGVEFLHETEPYKLAITSQYDYSATGGLVLVPIMGQDALGRCGLTGRTDTEIKVKHPGPQTVDDPHDELHVMSWTTTFARLPLNACHCVGVLTYPNAL